MECFLFFIVMLIALAVILSLGSRSQWRSSRRNSLFRQLAERFHGVSRPGNWFAPPSARLRYGTGMAIVDMVGNRNSAGRETRVHFRWPDSDFRCFACSQRPGSVEFDVNLPSYPVDGDDFDADFRVRSNDREKLRLLMSEGVQWHLQRMLDREHTDTVRLFVGENRFLVSRETEFTSYAGLEHFVRLALELYDQALLTLSVGIEFLDSDDAQVVQEARCQVCGDEIQSDMVFCRRCKTPHHQECWHYYGSCSTYGCREKQYHVPRVAQPSPSPKAGTDVEPVVDEALLRPAESEAGRPREPATPDAAMQEPLVVEPATESPASEPLVKEQLSEKSLPEESLPEESLPEEQVPEERVVTEPSVAEEPVTKASSSEAAATDASRPSEEEMDLERITREDHDTAGRG